MSLDPLTRQSAQDPYEVFETLLTGWRNVEDRQALKAWMDGVRLMNLRALEAGTHAVDAMALSSLPVHREDPWIPIQLLASQGYDGGPALYGDPFAYGGGLIYGQSATPRYRYPAPAGLAGFDFIQDSLDNPQVILDASQVRLDPVAHTLTFVQNPLGLFPVTLVNGAAGPDQQITLWARNARMDEQAQWYRFGAQLGLQGVSSTYYRETIRALQEILERGVTAQNLRRGLQSAAGLPVVKGGETIQRLDSLATAFVVSTDQNCYQYPPGSTPLPWAVPGLVLNACDEVVDTVLVSDLSDPTVQVPGLRGLALDRSSANLTGSVGVPNQDEVWKFSYRAGQPEVRHTLLGDPGVVQAYWDQVAAQGAAQGSTLAQQLGILTPGQAQAVNPFKFWVQNLLQGNLVVIQVRPFYFGASSTPGFWARLPGLLPRWTRFLFNQDLGSTTVDPYDASATNTTDTVACYPAVAPPSAVISAVGAGADLDLLDYTPSIMVA